MNLKHYILAAFIFFLSSLSYGQTRYFEVMSSTFFFDAICFKSDIPGKGRLDIYTIIPYQTIEFSKRGKIYGAHFEISVVVKSISGEKVYEKMISKIIKEMDYQVTQGSTAAFETVGFNADLPEGDYNVEVKLVDSYSNRVHKKSKKLTLINFDDYRYTVSGIMLVSSLEQRDGDYVVTPHLSDNIGGLNDGFFAFFEVYNSTSNAESDFVYQLIDKNNDTVYTSKKYSKPTARGRSQIYLKVPKEVIRSSGAHTLRIIALPPSEGNDEIVDSLIMAVAERAITNFSSMAGRVFEDLDKSIVQLEYIAEATEMRFINNAKNTEEKQERFIKFWKEHDPTPNTVRNEAYDDYFSRIEIANKRYRSYQKGWRSDKGKVFIILGDPNQIKDINSGGRYYEVWLYSDREIKFVDNTGTGDYRLYSPINIMQLYEYNR